jgi:FixJ family two-component response regulator
MMDITNSILLADGEPRFLESTQNCLHEDGYWCEVAADVPEAKELLKARGHAVLIADADLPGNRQLELVHFAQASAPGMPVVVLTAQPSVETATAAVELPVVAYLAKPIAYEQLRSHVERAMERSTTARMAARLQRQLRYCADELGPLSTKQGMATAGSAPGGAGVPRTVLHTLAGCLWELVSLAGDSGDVGLCELLQCPSRRTQRRSIYRAIELLQETKRRFKSKELAEVRRLLEDLLCQDDAGEQHGGGTGNNHRVA